MTALLLAWGLPASAATLVVDPSDPTAHATIAEAVAAATSGDTLALAGGTYTECVDPGGLDLTLEGPPSGTPATLDGTGACADTVTVEAGETLTLRTLSVANTGGRAVRFADSTVVLDGVTIDGAGAPDLAGGAVYGTDGTLSTSDCAFSNNQGTEGGAIYLYHGVQFTDSGSEFTRNTSVSGGGGAVFAYWNHTVTLEGTTFDGNTSAGSGGAVVASWYTVPSFSDTTWTDNTAGSSGGAIYTYVVDDTLTVTSSTFQRNAALDGWGGAIEVEWHTLLSVADSVFDANTATAAGGAISQWYETSGVATDSTFTGNSAGASGGAWYWNPEQGRADDLQVVRSTFRGNTSGSWGGGVYAAWADQIDVVDSVFDDNTAAGNGGGLGVYVATHIGVTGTRFCGNAASLGGGAQLEWATADVVSHTQFIDNTATRGGGLFRYASDDGIAEFNTFVGNQADTWGGAFVDEWGATTLEHTAFFHNRGVGAIFTEHASTAADTSVRFDAWGDNGEVHGAGYFWVELGTDGHVSGDPAFVAYSPGADCSTHDLHPRAGSVLVDAGAPDAVDRDGSRADIGAWGGEGAPLQDADGDGVDSDTDCLDGDPSVHPAAEEVCDGVDNNCDGTVDGAAATDATPWFLDLDGDGFGDPDTEALGCGGDGWVAVAGDCDDTDLDVHPDATDAWYDGVDSDCDGAPDHDADGDGHDKPVGDNGGRDCDDTDPTTHPGADDPPGDGIDQDCDGADDPAAPGETDPDASAPDAPPTDDKGGCSTVGTLPAMLGWLVLPALWARRRSA